MRIYLIKREPESVRYDEYAGGVVVAYSNIEARMIMVEETKNSNFATASYASCTSLGGAKPRVPKGVVLLDFKAG